MRTCSRSHDLTQTADAVGNSGFVNYISLGGTSRGVFTPPCWQDVDFCNLALWAAVLLLGCVLYDSPTACVRTNTTVSNNVSNN